jgi:hypothetical protein
MNTNENSSIQSFSLTLWLFWLLRGRQSGELLILPLTSASFSAYSIPDMKSIPE